jgi:hypothetical protein
MTDMIRRTLLAAACLLAAQAADAGAIDKLHQFLESTRTLRADFTQTVVARNGRQAQIVERRHDVLAPRQVSLADRQALQRSSWWVMARRSGSMIRTCARSRSGTPVRRSAGRRLRTARRGHGD